MAIISNDFRVHEAQAVDLGKWPTRVKPVCKSDKNWKFSEADIKERGFWNAYMQAYGQCLRVFRKRLEEQRA
jgi:hypothetical protein